MVKTVSILVKGKVQGVYFRQSTKEVARTIGVTGTVANLRDGSVQIEATGTEEQITQLSNWCFHGPSAAKVTSVEVRDLPPKQFDSFKIVRN